MDREEEEKKKEEENEEKEVEEEEEEKETALDPVVFLSEASDGPMGEMGAPGRPGVEEVRHGVSLGQRDDFQAGRQRLFEREERIS